MNQRKPEQLSFGTVAKAKRPKDPDRWVTGAEPMTRAQASYLKLLCEQAGEAFTARLTKAQAAKRIDSLRTNHNHWQERRAS